jgi:hypothetical protein
MPFFFTGPEFSASGISSGANHFKGGGRGQRTGGEQTRSPTVTAWRPHHVYLQRATRVAPLAGPTKLAVLPPLLRHASRHIGAALAHTSTG